MKGGYSYVDSVGVMNGRWDLGEDIMFLERGSTNRTTWQVYFERVKESVGDSVVSYDRGDSLGIPPSECTMKVVLSRITAEVSGDGRIGYVVSDLEGFISLGVNKARSQH